MATGFDDEPELQVGPVDDFPLEPPSVPTIMSEPVEPPMSGCRFDKLVRLYVYFILMFQTIFRLSDNALGVLLLFFATFLATVSQSLNLDGLEAFAAKLPRTVHAARVLSGRQSQCFKKFVCCPSCHSLYKLDKCSVVLPDKSIIPKLCEHVEFPNHPQHQHQKACGAPLMKRILMSDGSIKLSPYLVYCYKSLIESLQEMLLRSGFLEKCEMWRGRNSTSHEYRDVYDGQVWRDFMCVDGKQFLSLPYNFGLQLNVDWFQPYKHTQHAEGVMYLSILNLPRKERFLQENVLILGVIPGPKEPKKHINSFLRPLVTDLQDLWEGVFLQSVQGARVLVRAALLCVGCDIPAARKCCGFVGFAAYRGCSKCLCPFPTPHFGEKADYSDFDRSHWVPRTGDSHRNASFKYKSCNTRQKRKEIERDEGVRFSVLSELAYFDVPLRMCIIDPMHNLLLGTSKHMMELWKTTGILSGKDFEIIQKCVDSFITPSDIGRLPSKIASGFSGFTAEQWKNWTCYFSLPALKGVLPWQHYQCWQLFVKACYMLCKRQITTEQLQTSDKLLNEFCLHFVKLYGKEHCTINLHLHGHLASCVNDFGPVYAFWLFSFERLNGILGSYHTNNHYISVQLMRRFLDYRLFGVHNWPQEFHSEYLPLLQECNYNKGSLNQTTFESDSRSLSDLHVQLLPPVLNKAFSQEEVSSLRNWFSTGTILLLHRQCKAVKLSNVVVGASQSRYAKSSIVLANRSLGETGLAEILYFAEVVMSTSCSAKTYHWVAAVKWFERHPCKVWFGNPTQIWCTSQELIHNLIPLSAIRSRVVHSRLNVNFGRMIGSETVLVVVPLE